MGTDQAATKTSKPIILVGGGTGGHIMPLIAIGEELSLEKIPFIYVGGKNSREQSLVGQLNWSFVAIETGKWRRYLTPASLIANIIDSFRVLIGFFQAIRLLMKTRARVVFSKGGFVALPVVYAARLLGRRVIAHESDTVMGLTNRLTAGFAERVLTAFSPSVFPFASERYIQVGIPVRRALRQASKLKAPAKTRPLILIIAGIQGSTAVNSLLKPIIKDLIKRYDVVHSTGEYDFAKFKQFHQALNKDEQPHYRPFSFIDRELPYYYQAADLIIGRASATTLVEGSIFAKPMYLIPLPTSAGNHQVINARQVEKAEAAIVKEQYQLSSTILRDDIHSWLSRPDKLKAIGANLKNYFDEDQTIAKIMNILNEK